MCGWLCRRPRRIQSDGSLLGCQDYCDLLQVVDVVAGHHERIWVSLRLASQDAAFTLCPGPANDCELTHCTLLSFGVGFPNPRCSCRYADIGLAPVPEEVSLVSVSPKEVIRR